MKLTRPLALTVLIALTGCSSSSSVVEVRITPDVYEANGVSSKVATPVVDEVVRAKPTLVLLSFCKSTPNARIIQFERELRARHMSEMKGTFIENCPS